MLRFHTQMSISPYTQMNSIFYRPTGMLVWRREKIFRKTHGLRFRVSMPFTLFHRRKSLPLEFRRLHIPNIWRCLPSGADAASCGSRTSFLLLLNSAFVIDWSSTLSYCSSSLPLLPLATLCSTDVLFWSSPSAAVVYWSCILFLPSTFTVVFLCFSTALLLPSTTSLPFFPFSGFFNTIHWIKIKIRPKP